MNNTRELRPGTLVHNRYRIRSVLGAGGFGVTYQVEDLREGGIAAMKEYMPLEIAVRRFGSCQVVPERGQEEIYERFRERFLREAQTIYRYKGHPNIIRVQHLFYENNTAYYVMEYINGTDLRKYLDNHGQRLSWEAMRPIFSQVVEALKTVHRSGVIHCDISPDNIFLLQSGQIKLIDFGAAKNILRTKSTMMQYKRGYAPPEQIIANGNLGAWTDVYALAVTMYRCFTGRMPPPAESRVDRDELIMPSQMGLQVPSARWEQALRTALQLRYEQRFQTMEEFWAALTEQSVSRVRQEAAEPPVSVSRQISRSIVRTSPAIRMECISGLFAGRILVIDEEKLLGTDASRCIVAFPRGTPGISGVHVRLMPMDGTIIAMDMGSTYGTLLQGRPLKPGMAYPVNKGDVLILGRDQAFRRI